jgi:serine/threonine-protein kinase
MDNPIPSVSISPPTATSTGPGTDLSGKTFGDFMVLRRLGEGGMGQVYLAEQISLKRKVALKFLKADLAVNETSLRRFKAEAENVAQLNHANIVQVYAIGEAERLHYMAMEFVEGMDLRDYLAKKGPPDLPLALKIMIQVAAALAKAGEHDIAHRDIKPENILLTRKGLVKVADFGLARCFSPDHQAVNLTQSGVAMGTPLYMSPEQVTGHGVDLRTDIYSFGVTCYHMLAGEPPFKGETPFEVALQHVQAEPRPLREIRPDLPADLCAIVEKMIAKQPDQRYQTGRALLKDLNRLRNSLTETMKGSKSGHLGLASSGGELGAAASGSERPNNDKTLAIPPSRRNWLPWAVGASIFLALSLGAALGWMRNRPTDSPVAADTIVSPKKLVEEVDPKKEKESRLVKDAQDYANPGDDRSKVHTGLVYQNALALFYVNERRYDDADRFFKDLINNKGKVPAYNLLGRVGHAIVLAFQDKAAESNKLFVEIFNEKRPQMYRGAIGLVNGYPDLKQKIAEALDRNEANKETVPESLKDLRHPGIISLPAPKPGKKASGQ